MAMSKPLDQALTGDKALRAEGGDKAARKVFAPVGSITAALAASSCCVIPLVLFTLGVSGAWISHLTALAPYQPLFVVLSSRFSPGGFGWFIVSPRLYA
jgi:mercuric ion transport protein